MRHEHCQHLLLDHLYGLLDDAEAAGVDAHLAECDACAAARDAAALAQGLIARAAKVSFPRVQFVPPDQAVTTELPRVAGTAPLPNGRLAEPAKPAPARAPSGVLWGRWLVAASLLILIPAAVLPVSGWASRFEAARRAADRANAEYADALSVHERLRSALDQDRAGRRAAVASAKERHDRLLNDWVRDERAAAQADDRLTVEVNRPASLQPGAPNELLVSVRGPGREPVEAEVRDQDGKVLHRQTLAHAKGGDTVRLPSDVWGKIDPRSELFLVVSKIDEKTGTRTPLQDNIRLFGPVFTTLLVTDKPTYRPGETLFFRSLTLDRVSFRPPAHEQLLRYELRKLDNTAEGTPVPGLALAGSTEAARVTEGGVDPVTGPDGKPVRGVGCGSFALPPKLADGDYVLTLTEQKHPAGYAATIADPVRRSVRVRSGAVEQYQKRIGFKAAAYSPGEVVEAWAELKSNGQPVKDVLVEAMVFADGMRLQAQAIPAKTLKDGRVGISFELPKDVGRGEINLLAKFHLPNRQEQVAERVPLAGRDLIVEFFPEGGELVAGVPNRVYVRATNAGGRAVDVRGAVSDGAQGVAKVSTLTDAAEPGVNRGLGVFTITPRLGVEYNLQLEHPAKVAKAFPLPKVKTEGVVMSVRDAVTSPGQPVRVQLHTVGEGRNLVVGAYTRGRLADTKRVVVQPGKPAEVSLLTGNDPRGGVTRITVFDEGAGREWTPVAERLVFRKPGEKLNLSYSTGAKTFGPGSPVELSISATDEKGNPAAAILWASVVNEAEVDRPRDRLMPTHFLLAGETQSPDALEYADFLLTDHPRAAECLDLVLATQGWRRFVEQKPTAPKDELTADARRLLTMNGQTPIGAEASVARQHRELHASYWPRVEAAVKELEAAKKRAAEPDDSRAVTAAKETAEARRKDARAATDAAEVAAVPLAAMKGWAWFAVAGLVGLAAVLAAVTRLKPNGLGGVLPLGIGGAAALGLAAYLGVLGFDTRRAADKPIVGDVAPIDDQKPASAVRPKTEVMAMSASSADPPGAAGPTKKGVNPAEAGPKVNLPQPPNIIRGGGDPLPADLRWDGREPARDPAVRMHVAKTFASDAVEDPTLTAAKKSVADRDADLNRRMEEAVPKLDPVALERVRAAIPRMAPLVVREYAAPRPGTAGATPADEDTVLWLPLIVLPTDGKTSVSFGLGTGVKGYQVTIAGHTTDGRIGAVRGVLPVEPAAKAATPPTNER